MSEVRDQAPLAVTSSGGNGGGIEAGSSGGELGKNNNKPNGAAVAGDSVAGEVGIRVGYDATSANNSNKTMISSSDAGEGDLATLALATENTENKPGEPLGRGRTSGITKPTPKKCRASRALPTAPLQKILPRPSLEDSPALMLAQLSSSNQSSQLIPIPQTHPLSERASSSASPQTLYCIKVCWEEEIRKIKCRADLAELKSKCVQYFGLKATSCFNLTYQDEDDDTINIGTNEELLNLLNGPKVPKIQIQRRNKKRHHHHFHHHHHNMLPLAAVMQTELPPIQSVPIQHVPSISIPTITPPPTRGVLQSVIVTIKWKHNGSEFFLGCGEDKKLVVKDPSYEKRWRIYKLANCSPETFYCSPIFAKVGEKSLRMLREKHCINIEGSLGELAKWQLLKTSDDMPIQDLAALGKEEEVTFYSNTHDMNLCVVKNQQGQIQLMGVMPGESTSHTIAEHFTINVIQSEDPTSLTFKKRKMNHMEPPAVEK